LVERSIRTVELLLQAFDGALVALAGDGGDDEQQTQVFAAAAVFRLEEGLHLGQGVVQDVGQAVAGVDQAVDGVIPAARTFRSMRAAALWIAGTTRCTKKSTFTSNSAVASCTASSSDSASTHSRGRRAAIARASRMASPCSVSSASQSGSPFTRCGAIGLMAAKRAGTSPTRIGVSDRVSPA